MNRVSAPPSSLLIAVNTQFTLPSLSRSGIVIALSQYIIYFTILAVCRRCPSSQETRVNRALSQPPRESSGSMTELTAIPRTRHFRFCRRLRPKGGEGELSKARRSYSPRARLQKKALYALPHRGKTCSSLAGGAFLRGQCQVQIQPSDQLAKSIPHFGTLGRW